MFLHAPVTSDSPWGDLWGHEEEGDFSEAGAEAGDCWSRNVDSNSDLSLLPASSVPTLIPPRERFAIPTISESDDDSSIDGDGFPSR